MTRRYYSNVATPTTLSSGVSNSDVTLSVPTTTGFPSVPFTAAIDRGSADEELVLVTAKTSNSFTVTRGYDGTSAFSHDAGSPVEHVSAAIDFDEANAHINDTNLDHHTQYLNDTRHDALDHSTAVADLTVPIGGIIAWGGASAPSSKWKICNGDAISRTTYADLFGVLGETYGEGDGSSTFNLPDFRGRFPLGLSFSGRTFNADTMSRGHIGGEEYHQLSELEMPTHTHVQNSHIHEMPTHTHTGFTGTAGEHTHDIAGGVFLVDTTNPNQAGYQLPNAGVGAVGIAATGQALYLNNGYGVPGYHHAHNFTTNATDPGDTNPATATNQATGGGTIHQNMPPYQVITYIIRVL